MKSLSVFVAALPLLICVALADATATASVQFQFSGVVNNVVDPAGLLDGSVTAGTTVTGGFRFDPGSVDSFQGNPVFGTYVLPFDNLLQIFLGTYSITSGYKIDVVDGFNPSPGNPFGSDAYVVSWTGSHLRQDPVITNGVDTFQGADVNLLGLRLDDFDGTVFKSDELPLAPPDLNQFDARNLWIAFDDDSGVGQTAIEVTIDSLSAIPEPASLIVWSLLGLTATGSCWWRRRRTA